jgi:hypothetical protein
MAECELHLAPSTLYKSADPCDIVFVVSKTRPRAVRVFGTPILTTFSFSAASQESALPSSTAVFD